MLGHQEIPSYLELSLRMTGILSVFLTPLLSRGNEVKVERGRGNGAPGVYVSVPVQPLELFEGSYPSAKFE